jgi:hypothetical protein
MARGRKTGGRRRGTPNKATALTAARAAADTKAACKKLAKEALEDLTRLGRLPMAEERTRVFISYARADDEHFVERLHRDMGAGREPPWQHGGKRRGQAARAARPNAKSTRPDRDR